MDRYDKLESKLESKIDKVSDDVTEVKIEMSEVKALVKTNNEIMKEHIAGDGKIIDQIVPILDELGSMVQDHKYNKLKKEKLTEKLKMVSLKLGVLGTIVGIGAGIAKILQLF